MTERATSRWGLILFASIALHVLLVAVLYEMARSTRANESVRRIIDVDVLDTTQVASRRPAIPPLPPPRIGSLRPLETPPRKPKEPPKTAVATPLPAAPLKAAAPPLPPAVDPIKEVVVPPAPPAASPGIVAGSLNGSSGGRAGGGSSGRSGGPGGALTGGGGGGSEQGLVTGPSYLAAYLHNPPPGYPALARRMRLEGTTVVRVLVSPEGHPQRVTVDTSSGVQLLDDAALEAVRKWSFVPARRGQKAIAAEVNVPMRFRLTGTSVGNADASGD